MQKVRFLEDYGSFKKDTYRVIIGQNDEFYYIQINSDSPETTLFHKSKNGSLFQVVERS